MDRGDASAPSNEAGPPDAAPPDAASSDADPEPPPAHQCTAGRPLDPRQPLAEVPRQHGADRRHLLQAAAGGGRSCEIFTPEKAFSARRSWAADGAVYIGSADRSFYALNPDGNLALESAHRRDHRLRRRCSTTGARLFRFRRRQAARARRQDGRRRCGLFRRGPSANKGAHQLVRGQRRHRSEWQPLRAERQLLRSTRSIATPGTPRGAG